jgi:hypothetical protein
MRHDFPGLKDRDSVPIQNKIHLNVFERAAGFSCEAIPCVQWNRSTRALTLNLRMPGNRGTRSQSRHRKFICRGSPSLESRTTRIFAAKLAVLPVALRTEQQRGRFSSQDRSVSSAPRQRFIVLVDVEEMRVNLSAVRTFAAEPVQH